VLKEIMFKVGASVVLLAVATGPAVAQRPSDPVPQLTVGHFHTCEIRGTKAYCWGAGEEGQLGNGGTTDRTTPVPVRAPEGVVFTQLTAGGVHTCGISGTKAYCWGYGRQGQLGNGGTTDQATPVPVRAPEGVVFTQLTAGGDHTCGISGTKAYCWGISFAVGDGSDANQTTPVPVRAPEGVVFTQLTAGGHHTCGISGTKTYCWGYGLGGELGDGSTSVRRTPVQVRAPQGVVFTQLTAGLAHTCGISGTRTFCWGDGTYGGLGDGAATDRTTPVRVRTPDGVAFAQVTAGGGYTCGISGTRTFCWGSGTYGGLGDGAATDRTTPVRVRTPDGVVFSQLGAGVAHACGISGTRTHCWGYGQYGQLGDGATTNRTTPVPVRTPGVGTGESAYSTVAD
jgi:alpha-tubulin suppressor-like RCC1 family protein